MGLNKVNIVTVTKVLVLHVGVIGQHVPRHCGFIHVDKMRIAPCGVPNELFLRGFHP